VQTVTLYSKENFVNCDFASIFYTHIFMFLNITYVSFPKYDIGACMMAGGRGGEGTVERYHPEEDRWEILDQRLASEDQEYSAVILDRVV
jgi:hypothetical protein